MIKGCGQSAWGCGETGSVDLVNRTSTNTAVADTVTGSLAQSYISRMVLFRRPQMDQFIIPLAQRFLLMM
jgi:hypothetical protein